MAGFCRYCGKPKREDSKFCLYCGKKLVETEQPVNMQPGQVQQPVTMQPGQVQQPVNMQQAFYAQPNSAPVKKSSMLPVIAVCAGVFILIIAGTVGGIFAFKKLKTPKEDNKPKEATTLAVKEEDIGNVVLSEGKDTMTNGELSVKLSESGGQALLVEDNAPLPEGAVSGAYDLVLSEDDGSRVMLKMEVEDSEAAAQGAVTRIKAGFPYVDSEGVEDFLWVPLESTQNGNVVTAKLDLEEYDGAVDMVRLDGNGNLSDESLSYAKRLLKVAGKKPKKAKYSMRIFSESVYQVVSSKGHFSINIPVTKFNFEDDPVRGKLREIDAERLGEDMEGILSWYKERFPKNTRSKWPMDVENDPDKKMAGRYGGSRVQNGCFFYINYVGLPGSYKNGGSYDGDSLHLYHTLAHEMFHFIQMEYTNPLLSAVWFDEATGAYYENVVGDRAGVDHTTNKYDDIGEELAIRQYDGITPSSSFFVTNSTATDDGYGRRPLIEYLVKICGDDFMPKLMRNYTVTSAGKPMEDLIVKQSGRSMPELTRGYYDSLVAKGELVSRFSLPWEIYLDDLEKRGVQPSKMGVLSKMKITGSGSEKFSFPLPRYGAHFVLLDFNRLPAKYEKFTVKLDTDDTTATLFDISGEDYDHTDVLRSFEGEHALSDIPITGHSYLLMVVNESETHYTESSPASVSITCGDMNSGSGGDFPKEAKQVPAEYSGELTWRKTKMNKAKTFQFIYEKAPATARVSMDDSGTLSVSIVSDLDGDEMYNEKLRYDPKEGQGTGEYSTLQFERGDYNSRNNARLRLIDCFGTGSIYSVFEGYGGSSGAAGIAGTYKPTSDPGKLEDATHGNDASKAVTYALNNVTVTIGKDGSFSGSGSWSDDYSSDEPVEGSSTTGSQKEQEHLSAQISFSGKVGENGEGTFSASGSSKCSGSLDSHVVGTNDYTRVTEDSQTEWSAVTSFSGKGTCSVGRNGEDQYLSLHMSCDADRKGEEKYNSKSTREYLKVDQDPEIKTDSGTRPMSEEDVVSFSVGYKKQ